MPRISIKTEVKGSAIAVFDLFDEKLFDFLAPPSWLAKKVLYEGTSIGNKVAMQFFLPFSSRMEVEITSKLNDGRKYWFVDEGILLPFGIKSWKHQHIVIDQGDCSIIHDCIDFSTSNRILDVMYFPIFYMAFKGRTKPYQKYFGICRK